MTDVIKYLEEIKEHQMQTVQLARSTEVYKLADKALKAINVMQCSTQLKEKEAMSFNDWVKSEGYEEKFTGFWKDGKSQDYWTMKDKYNVYKNNL